MKRLLLAAFVAAIVAAAAVFATGVLPATHSAGAGATSSPAGRTYQVTVIPSFDPANPFQDCFRFGMDGSFQVDLLGSGAWIEISSTPSATLWRAVGFGPGFLVLFTGVTFPDTGQTLRSFGVSSQGNFFLVSGSENPDCSVVVPASSGGWQE